MGPARERRRMRLCVVLILLVLSSGCSLVNPSANLGSWWNRNEPRVATQMVPVWSDTVLHQAGEPATRGVGGRVMFYGLERHRTIRTEGVLVVYVWDDSLGTSQRSPDRKYVFPAGDLEQHYSHSRMGHSYSFWLPWDAAGGAITHLTVVTRFVGVEGTELTSSPAHVVLPGPGDGSQFYESLARQRSLQAPADAAAQSQTQNSAVTQAAYTDDIAGEREAVRQIAGGRESVSVTEIALPPGFLNRNLRGSGSTGSEPLTGFTGLQQDAAVRDRDAAVDAEAVYGDGQAVPGENLFAPEVLRMPRSADSELDQHRAPATAAVPPSAGPFQTGQSRRVLPVGSRRTPATKSLVPQPRQQQRWPIPGQRDPAD